MKKLLISCITLSLFFAVSCSKKPAVPVQPLYNFKELNEIDKLTPVNSELKPPLTKEWDRKLFESKFVKRYTRIYRNLFVRYHPEEFSTPEVYDKKIYLGGSDGNFYCLNELDGKLVWKHSGTGAIFGAPLINDDSVYISSGGFFWKLNAQNGKPAWKYPIETDVISKPLIYKSKIFIMQNNNKLSALDINSGEKIWTYAEEMPEKLTILGSSSPVFYDGLIYLGFANGVFAAINPNDGVEVWKKAFKGTGQFPDIDGTALIENNRIYIAAFDDHIYSLNLKDGSIVWKFNLGGISKGEIYKDSIIYSTSTGALTALNLKDGTLKWGVQEKDKFFTPPAIIGNVAYFCDNEKFLYAVNLDSAKLIWKYAIKGGSYSKPVYDSVNRRLIIHSNDGYVYSFSSK